jgi:hypothetical protein
MSSIDAQIKALLLKKKKIDYVSYIADLVKNDTKCVDFKDVKKEIIEKIEPFLLQLMESIEKDTELKTSKSDGLSAEEVSTLKAVAARVKSQPTAPAPTQPNQPQAPAPKPAHRSDMSPNEKMNFALTNRHLANKKVQVIGDAGVKILGTIVGLDAPNVIVQTDTGPTIEVELSKVVLQ